MEIFKNKYDFLKEKGYYCDKLGNVYNKKHDPVGTKVSSTGYYKISIRIDKKLKKIHCHRFIAYEKYGNEMFNHFCVRHLDGNPLNNSWDNILLGSHSDNMMDVPKEVRRKKASLANKIHNHLQIIDAHKNGMPYSQIMKVFNISSKGTVSYIINKSMSLEN
jgi:hypothetical protein